MNIVSLQQLAASDIASRISSKCPWRHSLTDGERLIGSKESIHTGLSPSRPFQERSSLSGRSNDRSSQAPYYSTGGVPNQPTNQPANRFASPSVVNLLFLPPPFYGRPPPPLPLPSSPVILQDKARAGVHLSKSILAFRLKRRVGSLTLGSSLVKGNLKLPQHHSCNPKQ